MPEYVDRLTSLAQSALSRLRVSSALNGGLYLCSVVVPSCLIATHFLTGGAQIAVIVLMFIPVLVFCRAFLYFMKTDPSKLRSEDYEIRKQALELIQEKGSRNPQLGITVEAIANPDYTRRLPSGTDREEASS